MKKDERYTLRRLFSILDQEDSNGIRCNAPHVRYGKWETNGLGFRGSEIDPEKRKNWIRIACLGASETFGVFESKDKEWPAQLGEMLRDKPPGVEVINAAVPGLKIKMLKGYVEKYVLPLKPDVMIVNQTSLLTIKDSMRGVKSKPFARRGNKKKRKNLVKEFLLRVEETVKGCLPERLFTRIDTRGLRRKLRKKERKYLRNRHPVDTVPENIISEIEKDLKSFIFYLKKNQIVPVLSIFPTLIRPFNREVYENMSLATRLTYCMYLSEQGIMDALEKTNDTVRKIAREQGLIFIDNDRLMPKTLEYFADNFHYTDKGAECVARNVYDILNQSNLIKQS